MTSSESQGPLGPSPHTICQSEPDESGPRDILRKSRRVRWILGASIAVALLVLAIRVGWYHYAGLMPDMVLDDSYISFRYARNLVRGHGLVYNVGERVEGYTNFLWTVGIAGGMAGGLDPETVAEILAVLSALGSILLLGLLAERFIRGAFAAPARFLPPVLFAAIGSQARHVVSGMETLLFVFLVLAGFAYLFLRGQILRVPAPEEPDPSFRRSALVAGGVFGLAALTRPEGLLYAAIAGLYLLWQALSKQATGGPFLMKLRAVALFGSGVLAFVVPHLAWRLSYYGYPFPNTYYAKVGGALSERLARGLGSLSRGMADWDIWPILVLSLLALPTVRQNRIWITCYGIAVAAWAAFVWVGGDFVHAFGPRLLMPALPFLLLLAGEGVRLSASGLARWIDRRRVVTLLVATAVVGLVVHAMWRPWPTRAGRLGGLATMHHIWRATGEWLAEAAPPGALIATTAAGIIPYVSDRPTVDMFGLTDGYIAHHAEINPSMPPAHGKSDPVYVLERRPEFLHVLHLTPEGVPETAGLGWVAGRISQDYKLVAQVMARRGQRVRDRWVIETTGFRRDLYRRGYTTGVFQLKP